MESGKHFLEVSIVAEAQFKVTVESQRGVCGAGHKAGDEVLVGPGLPMSICALTYHCMYPNMRTLLNGGSLPWEKVENGFRLACPDPDNPVVFRVVRIAPEPK